MLELPKAKTLNFLVSKVNLMKKKMVEEDPDVVAEVVLEVIAVEEAVDIMSAVQEVAIKVARNSTIKISQPFEYFFLL
jgi:t-SNARE complex subunit (syntaxin)